MKSVFRRVIAIVALVVGIGVASASVSAADAAPTASHVSASAYDWFW